MAEKWILCRDESPLVGVGAFGFAEVEDDEKSLKSLEDWCLKKKAKAFKYKSYKYAFPEKTLNLLSVVARF